MSIVAAEDKPSGGIGGWGSVIVMVAGPSGQI